jgi:hypothetical protein
MFGSAGVARRRDRVHDADRRRFLHRTASGLLTPTASPDGGKRFLSVTDFSAQPGQGDSINAVVNWLAELRAKVGR